MSATAFTTTPVITLTDNAAAKVTELIAREGDDQLALRVAVKAGGCSGMSYEMFFDAEADPEDHEVVFGTAKVRVDLASVPTSRVPPSTTRTASRTLGFTSRTPTPSAPAAAGRRSREA